DGALRAVFVPDAAERADALPLVAFRADFLATGRAERRVVFEAFLATARFAVRLAARLAGVRFLAFLLAFAARALPFAMAVFLLINALINAVANLDSSPISHVISNAYRQKASPRREAFNGVPPRFPRLPSAVIAAGGRSSQLKTGEAWREAAGRIE